MIRFIIIILSFAIAPFVYAQCPIHVSISSDTELTGFLENYPSCADIEGNLTLSGVTLTNLAGLENIVHVGGNISIHHTGLNNLNGLNNLVQVEGTFRIFRNDSLFSLDGLNALENIGSGLVLSRNSALQNTNGIVGLHTVGDFLRIVDNDKLNDVSGFDSLSTVHGIISFKDNAQSFPFDGFNHIQEPVTRIRLSGNGVSSIDGFNSVPEVNKSVNISNNNTNGTISGFNSIVQIGENFVYVDNSQNADTFSGLQNLLYIDSSLYVKGTWTHFSLSTLQHTNNVFFRGQLNHVQFPSLVTVGDFLWFEYTSLPLNDSLHFPHLYSIGEGFRLYKVSNANLSLPELTIIGGFFWVSGSDMKYVKMPALSSIGDFLQFNSVSILNNDSFYFPSLSFIENDFNFYNNNVYKVCLPALSDVGGINFSNANFLSFSAPLINKCDNLTFNNSSLVDFDLQNLDTIYETIYINNNDNLMSLESLSNLDFVAQSIQILNNNALSDCSANAICNKIVTSPSEVFISGNIGGCYSLNQVALSCDFSEDGVSGNVFFDFDCNGMNDSTDMFANAISVKGLNDNFYTLTDNTGNYALDIISYPQFKISPEIINGYQRVPELITVYPSLDTASYNNINFRYCPDGILHDVKVSLTPFKAATPNSTQQYKISLSNIGNQTENFALYYSVPRNYNGVYYNIIDADGGVILGDSIITWSFEQVNPMHNEYLTVSVEIGNDSPIDSSIFSYAMVSLDAEILDANSKDNIDSLNEKIATETNPIRKTGSPEALVTGLGALNELEYIIYFQNTGTAPVNSVVIVDTLDSYLWDSNLEMIAASHNYQLNTQQNGVLKWEFDDINLLDSASNLLESFGFVRFTLKGINLYNSENIIKNTARVYFDDSPATVTNTVLTEVLSHLPLTNSLLKIGSEDEPIHFESINDFPAIDQAYPFTGIKLLSLPIKGDLFFNNFPIVVNQIIPSDSISFLTFMPDANDFNNTSFYASVQFRAMNQYGLSNQKYLTFKIFPTNDQPITQSKTIEIYNDEFYAFNNNDFPYTDIESDGAYNINIKSLPTNAGLYINNDLVLFAPQTIASTEINWLTLIPSSDLNGTQTSSFEFTVSDPEDLESLPSTVTFNILDATPNSTIQPSGWNLQVAPNPVNDRVSFTGNLPACPASVQLFDMSGCLLESYEYKSGEIAKNTIPLAFLPAGNYTLKVTCNNQFHVFSIVKI